MDRMIGIVLYLMLGCVAIGLGLWLGAVLPEI